MDYFKPQSFLYVFMKEANYLVALRQNILKLIL